MPAPKRKQTAVVQLKVRMREPLRAKLESAAAKKGTSINSEVVDRLERSFERQDLLAEFLTLMTALGRRDRELVRTMLNVDIDKLLPETGHTE